MTLWSIEAEDILHYLPDSTANVEYPPIKILPFIQRHVKRMDVVSTADYVSGYSLLAPAEFKQEEGHFTPERSDGREEAYY